MSTALKEQVVQHWLDVADFGLNNARIKNGVPLDFGQVRVTSNETQTTTSSTSSEQVAPSPPPQREPTITAPQSVLPQWVKTAGIIGVSTLLGGGGMAAALSPFLTGTPPAVQSTEKPESGLLIPWLQDKGLNVSPEAKP